MPKPPALDRQKAIVEDDGTPTNYFMRFMQQRGGLLGDYESLAALLEAMDIIAGAKLSGGGSLLGGVDITIDHEVSGVTADTYGAEDLVPVITVDVYGHVTAVEEVPIAATSGGSGGILPVVDGSIPPTFIQNPDGSLVFTEIL